MSDPEGSDEAAALTYREADVGATRCPESLPPPGFTSFRVRTRLGAGGAVYRAATEALLEWRMHRAVGVTIEADAPRAALDGRVVVGLGVGRVRLRAPCRVVWVEEGPDRTGWAYGTLPGHPECGEEAFLLTREADDTVWLTVTAFSRPARWYVRAAGPLVGVAQRAYARRCGRVLRRLARAGAVVPPTGGTADGTAGGTNLGDG